MVPHASRTHAHPRNCTLERVEPARPPRLPAAPTARVSIVVAAVHGVGMAHGVPAAHAVVAHGCRRPAAPAVAVAHVVAAVLRCRRAGRVHRPERAELHRRPEHQVSPPARATRHRPPAAAARRAMAASLRDPDPNPDPDPDAHQQTCAQLHCSQTIPDLSTARSHAGLLRYGCAPAQPRAFCCHGAHRVEAA